MKGIEMVLTAMAVAKAKPKEKPYKLADSKGLFLLVQPNGGKYWRIKYRYLGKEKLLSLGVFPEVELAVAREKTLEARKLLVEGIDPSNFKKEKKRQAILAASNTFKAVAEEWHARNLNRWSEDHGPKLLRRLELHIFPDLGNRPIGEIKPLELLHVLQKVEKRDTTEVLRRINQTCSAVFEYGMALELCEMNAAVHIRKLLKVHRTQHYPTLSPRELPEFFRRLEKVETSELNKLAIELLLLTFVRQGEMRRAKWEDVNFETREWHLSPLPCQQSAFI